MTKFVILCQPRTGSSLLTISSRAHPHVFMHSEVLNHGLRHDLPQEGYQRLVAALGHTTHEAVGCKLHCFQPDRGWGDWSRWEPAWDALADDASIKVIHLRRLDTLAQLVSWKIANILRWWSCSNTPDRRPTVRVDPAELYWFRQWNRSLYEWRLSRLKRHEILPLTYESLSDDWDATIRQVQEFLGVEPLALEQSTRKIETRPLSEVIENYSELNGT